MRSHLWPFLSLSQQLKNNSTMKYAAIAEKGHETLSNDRIHEDIKRSALPSPLQQTQLGNILRAFAFYKPKIGYEQGMNYIG